MAQNFRNYLPALIGVTPVDALSGAVNSYDCLISIRLANVLSTSINVDVYIKRSATDYYLIKTAPIIPGSSLELIDGGSKIVLESGDQLYVVSDTASSLNCIIGAVDSISS
tara:strand:- start:125 stop:457 length:333 start_codon:yes stop_codon:yes gene_type:complete